MVYKWYILPIGGLYATYHLLGEPETTSDFLRKQLTLLGTMSYPLQSPARTWVDDVPAETRSVRYVILPGRVMSIKFRIMGISWNFAICFLIPDCIWSIYLHLPYKSSKCWSIYPTWNLWIYTKPPVWYRIHGLFIRRLSVWVWKECVKNSIQGGPKHHL